MVAVPSLRDALTALRHGDPQVDVALLSVESCGTDVVATVEAIRAENDLPLVVMATKASADKCAEALLAGADDYLARLVSIDELMARIQVLLRRYRRCGESSWRLVAGDVEIDLERRSVRVAGEHVDLTTTEFKVLSIIARQGGRVCTKEKILANVWTDTSTAADKALRAHVAALRSKIRRPNLIETVEFVGYRLATRPTVHSDGRSDGIIPAVRGVDGAR